MGGSRSSSGVSATDWEPAPSGSGHPSPLSASSQSPSGQPLSKLSPLYFVSYVRIDLVGQVFLTFLFTVTQYLLEILAPRFTNF